jgi:hypothetical protein
LVINSTFNNISVISWHLGFKDLWWYYIFSNQLCLKVGSLFS